MAIRRKIDVSEYRIPIPCTLLKSPVTLCHISDIHSRRYGDYSTEAAKAIAARAYDALICTGDAIDCSWDVGGDLFFTLLDQLPPHPTLVSPGNHEKRIECSEGSLPFAERCRARGIHYLDNAAATLSFDTQTICFYGYIQPFRSFGVRGRLNARLRQNIHKADLMHTLGPCRTDVPVVLLAHDPAPFASYAAWGAPLTLSGHMHGGSVRLPLVGGLLSPARTFFPRYDAGLYRDRNSHMIVSRGLAASLFPPRIRNHPEVAFITLYPQKEA